MGLSFRFYDNLKAVKDRTGFYYDSGVSMTREQLDNFWAEHPQAEESADISAFPVSEKSGLPDIVLFQTQEAAQLENPSLNRHVSVTLINAAGAMEVLLPDTLMLGNFPSSGDTDGCVISRKTAEALYSSREALGETLQLEGNTYTVRGILDIEEELCVIQGSSHISYSNLCTYAPNLPLSAIQQQLSGILPFASAVVSEGGLYFGLGGILLWLPAWVLLFHLAKAAAVFYKSLEPSIAKKTSGAFLLLLLSQLRFVLPFMGGCGILLGCLHFSDDYVPTAWSDFAFWTGLVSEKSASILTLMRYPLSCCDTRMLLNLAGLAAVSITETLLWCYFIAQIKQSFLPCPPRQARLSILSPQQYPPA